MLQLQPAITLAPPTRRNNLGSPKGNENRPLFRTSPSPFTCNVHRLAPQPVTTKHGVRYEDEAARKMRALDAEEKNILPPLREACYDKGINLLIRLFS